MIRDGSIDDFILINQRLLLQQWQLLGVGAIVLQRQTVTCFVKPEAEVLLGVLVQVRDGIRGQAFLHVASALVASLHVWMIAFSEINLFIVK